MSKFWLARTAAHEFLGPTTEAQIREWVIDGKLKPQDEICPSLGYWFSVYEFDEVEKHLGIRTEDLRWANANEATQLHIHTDATDPAFQQHHKPVLASPFERKRNPSVESEPVLRGLLWLVVLIILSVGALVLRKVKL